MAITPAQAAQATAEIARRLDEVAGRFEALANQLDMKYVRNDLFTAYKELVEAKNKVQDQALADTQKRVAELEDGRKWLSRLIIGFIVLAVLGAVFTVAKTGA